MYQPRKLNWRALGTVRITGIPFPLDAFKSEHTVDEETAGILSMASRKKKRKPKKKGEGKPDEEES